MIHSSSQFVKSRRQSAASAINFYAIQTVSQTISPALIFKLFKLLIFATVFTLTLTYWSIGQAAEPEAQIKPQQTTLFDLKILQTDQQAVLQHFSAIGGFQRYKISLKNGNFDKYYSHSQLNDSYYLDFRYNSAGQLVKVNLLYRPFSDKMQSRYAKGNAPLNTRTLALQFTQIYGPATLIQRKGWGGITTYDAYTWEDEQIKIQLDRQNNDPLGNILVSYQIKQLPQYFADTKENYDAD